MIVLHGLHYLTEKKSEEIYTIENHYPLLDISMKCFVGNKKVTQVVDVLNQKELVFEVSEGYVTIHQEVLVPHVVYKIVF